MDQRFEALRDRLSAHQAVAVAFSGGADSTLLLAAARDVLGADHVVALTAVTPYMVREEIGDAIGMPTRWWSEPASPSPSRVAR